MPSILCQNCDGKIKVSTDEERNSVRCPACGHRTRLDEPDDDDRRPARPRKKTKRSLRVKSSDPMSLGDLVSLGIPVGLGCVLIGLSFVHPVFALLGLLAGQVIFLFAFIRGCMSVAKEGSWVSFDYLEFLGPIRWLLAIGFLGLYLMGYVLLWFWTQISYAVGDPRKIGPWLGLQAFGVFVCVAVMVAASISDHLWGMAGRNSPQAVGPQGPPTVFNNPPRPNNPAPDVKPQSAPDNTPPAVVTGDAALDKLLADLAGGQAAVSTDAARKLAAMKPDAHQAVVARKLGEKIRQTPSPNRAPFGNALGVWATAGEVPILIDLLADKDVNTRNEVLKVIGKLRDERTVAPVLRCFVEFQTRYHGEQALKDLGPMAETEVLGLLKHNDSGLRVNAVRILQEIGTQQSVPALQAASQGELALQFPAKEAIAAINARNKQK